MKIRQNRVSFTGTKKSCRIRSFLGTSTGFCELVCNQQKSLVFLISTLGLFLQKINDFKNGNGLKVADILNATFLAI
jgi:hypothetical protein